MGLRGATLQHTVLPLGLSWHEQVSAVRDLTVTHVPVGSRVLVFILELSHGECCVSVAEGESCGIVMISEWNWSCTLDFGLAVKTLAVTCVPYQGA